jgi:hypothetical protein
MYKSLQPMTHGRLYFIHHSTKLYKNHLDDWYASEPTGGEICASTDCNHWPWFVVNHVDLQRLYAKY